MNLVEEYQYEAVEILCHRVAIRQISLNDAKKYLKELKISLAPIAYCAITCPGNRRSMDHIYHQMYIDMIADENKINNNQTS